MNPIIVLLGAATCTFVLAVTSHAADGPVSPPTVRPHSVDAESQAAAKSANRTNSPTHRLRAICSAADHNHDGTVSLDEFHQDIVQSWHNLGPDANGYVPLSGLGQIPRIGKSRLKRLALADKDSDGNLSFKEVVEARMTYFEAADTDQSGDVSLQECIAYERNRRR